MEKEDEMNGSVEERNENAVHHEMTVGQWVARYPGTARVFETRGIDYCCAGKRSLEDACSSKGLDAAKVRADLLEEIGKAASSSDADWEKASLGELLDHIVSTHHRFLREEKPRLIALAHKVARVHGDHHPELVELAAAVDRIFRELDPHLDLEEQVHFPAFRKWESAGQSSGADLVGNLETLEDDHVEVGGILEAIRSLASGFEPPQDACNSYLALFHGLEQLEADLHAHIHKENNILHARILARRDV